MSLYKDQNVNDNIDIYLTNDARTALDYTKEILVANVHERRRTKRILEQAGGVKCVVPG